MSKAYWENIVPGPLNSVGHSGVVCVLILWRNTDNPERCIITFVKENSVTLITMWYREGVDVWTRRNSRRLRSCQDSFCWNTPFSETLSTLLEQVCQILVQRYKCCSVRNFWNTFCVLRFEAFAPSLHASKTLFENTLWVTLNLEYQELLLFR